MAEYIRCPNNCGGYLDPVERYCIHDETEEWTCDMCHETFHVSELFCGACGSLIYEDGTCECDYADEEDEWYAD